MSENKRKEFLPRTFIEWLTTIFLIIGISTTFVGTVIKLYSRVVVLESVVEMHERRIDILERANGKR